MHDNFYIPTNKNVGRFQDFYEEGEKEMLLSELSELRRQVSITWYSQLFQVSVN